MIDYKDLHEVLKHSAYYYGENARRLTPFGSFLLAHDVHIDELPSAPFHNLYDAELKELEKLETLLDEICCSVAGVLAESDV